jgi:histidine triad (HIT) family protein
MGDDCIFCEIARGEAPALIVDENELAFALLDIQALSEGHCLVVPRRHVPWWDGLPAVEADAVFRLAHATAGRIRRAFSPDCVTMYARGRRAHAHLPGAHVQGRPARSGVQRAGGVSGTGRAADGAARVCGDARGLRTVEERVGSVNLSNVRRVAGAAKPRPC